MRNTTFNNVPFTTAALKLAKEKIASLKQKDRKYLEQALCHEYDTIQDSMQDGGEFHDYMLVSDVQRVLNILKIQ